MKLVIGCTVILVLAAAVWLGLNTRREKWVNEISVDIDRPARDVFPWLRDPVKRKQWILFLKDSREAGDGRLREVIADHGGEYPVDVRVVRCEEGRLFETASTSSAFDWEQSYELVDRGSATTLRIRIETQYRPWLARALAPLVSRDVQATWARHAEQLRSLLNRNSNGDPSK